MAVFMTWTNGSQLPLGNTSAKFRAAFWVKSFSLRTALTMLLRPLEAPSYSPAVGLSGWHSTAV